MHYRIEQDKSKREAFGNYNYRIFSESRLVARYWHDYRGDDHGIEFVNAVSAPWPVGRMTKVVELLQPQVHVLSKAQHAALRLAKKRLL